MSATLDDTTSPHELMAFHARHKMALLALHPRLAAALGRIAASARSESFARDLDEYAAAFEDANSRVATRGGHVNALQHLAGHIEDRGAAKDISRLIDEYGRGRCELAAVKEALHARLVAEGAQWAAAQSYLHP